MPIGRLLAGRFVIVSSSRSILPVLGVSNPATIRKMVVLPQPLGPSKVRNSPCSTAKLISITAVDWPKYLVICSSSRNATDMLLIILLLRYQVYPQYHGFLVESAPGG